MTTFNPYVDDNGVTFPGTLLEIDALKERMLAHIARVTVEHAGLKDVMKVLDKLERWRASDQRREHLAACGIADNGVALNS